MRSLSMSDAGKQKKRRCSGGRAEGGKHSGAPSAPATGVHASQKDRGREVLSTAGAITAGQLKTMGGALSPQSHNLKPDHRLTLPSSYYQSELRRAEANLRLALSHGPRLRRAVRRPRARAARGFADPP